MAPMEPTESLNTTQPTDGNRLWRFAFAYVTVISLFALLCAATLASVANDMYAFVKPDRTVTLSLDEPLPLPELAKRLEQEGILANPTVFRLYVRAKGKEAVTEAFSGELTLHSSMSYRELLLAFSSVGDAETR